MAGRRTFTPFGTTVSSTASVTGGIDPEGTDIIDENEPTYDIDGLPFPKQIVRDPIFYVTTDLMLSQTTAELGEFTSAFAFVGYTYDLVTFTTSNFTDFGSSTTEDDLYTSAANGNTNGENPHTFEFALPAGEYELQYLSIQTTARAVLTSGTAPTASADADSRVTDWYVTAISGVSAIIEA